MGGKLWYRAARLFWLVVPSYHLIVSLSSLSSGLRDNKLFHDGVPYHAETGSLICGANQWTGFYMMENSTMKEFILKCIGKAPISYNKNPGLIPGGMITLEQYFDVARLSWWKTDIRDRT